MNLVVLGKGSNPVRVLVLFAQAARLDFAHNLEASGEARRSESRRMVGAELQPYSLVARDGVLLVPRLRMKSLKRHTTEVAVSTQ